MLPKPSRVELAPAGAGAHFEPSAELEAATPTRKKISELRATSQLVEAVRKDRATEVAMVLAQTGSSHNTDFDIFLEGNHGRPTKFSLIDWTVHCRSYTTFAYLISKHQARVTDDDLATMFCDSAVHNGAAFCRLVASGVPINFKDARGCTALNLVIDRASGKETSTAVQRLLSNGADMSIADNDGVLPLEKVTRCRAHLRTLRVFLKYGTAGGAKALRHLVTAAWEQELAQSTQALLEAGVPADACVTDLKDSPLRILVSSTAPCMAKEAAALLLIRAGATLSGHTVPLLCFAASAGYCNVVRLLLEKGVGVNEYDPNGYTPLMRAARGPTYSAERTLQFEEIIQLLINAGCDRFVRGGDGHTALVLAAGHLTPDTIRLLLQGRPPGYINLAAGGIHVGGRITKDGQTPLTLAVMCRNAAVVEVLLEEGADVNVVDDYGWRALQYVCNDTLWYETPYAYQKIIQLLLAHGSKVDPTSGAYGPLRLFASPVFCPGRYRGLGQSGSSGQTALALDGDTTRSILSMHMSAGASVNAIESDGMSPLMAAVHSGNVLMVQQLLLCAGCDVNVVNSRGESALCMAVRSTLDMEDIRTWLLDAGAHVNATPRGNPLFLTCIEEESFSFALLLAQRGVDVLALDRGPRKLVHALLEQCSRHGGYMGAAGVDLFKYLLEIGCDVCAPDAAGVTPLMLSTRVSCGKVPELSTQLMYHGAATSIDAVDNVGQTALIRRCAQPRDSAVTDFQPLLEAGADPEIVDKKGLTALAHLLANDPTDWALKQVLYTCSSLSLLGPGAPFPLHELNKYPEPVAFCMAVIYAAAQPSFSWPRKLKAIPPNVHDDMSRILRDLAWNRRRTALHTWQRSA